MGPLVIGFKNLAGRIRREPPRRIALLYLIFGLLWIWLTDRFFVWFGLAGEPAYLLASLKGTLFVFVSAILIYWLLHREWLAIRKQEAVLRAVAEGTPDAVFVKDIAGKYQLLNHASLDMLGKSIEETLGKNDAELFGDEKAQQFRAQDIQVMQSPKIHAEERQLLIDGKPRVFHVTKAAFHDHEGNVLGIIGISRDITERKHAEDALRASEERYRSLIELAPDGIAVFCDGRLTYLNQAGARILKGESPEQFIGLILNEYVHPDDLAESTDRQRRILEQRVMIPLHAVRFRAFDGTYVPLEVCAGPCLVDGRPAIQVIARDVTERQQAEIALRVSEERYRTLVEASADGIFVNRGGKIVYANPSLLRMLGATHPDQVLNKTPYDIVHPRYHDLIRDRIRQLVEEQRTVPPIHQTYIRLDGTCVDVEVMGVPVVDAGVVSIEVIARDITERRRTEETLRRSHQFRETVIRTAAEGICVCYPIPDFPYVQFSLWNDQMVELTGYTIDEINRQGWYQSVYPDPAIRQQVIDRMNQMREGDDLVREEWTITRKDGATRIVAITTSVIHSEDGVMAVMAMMQDITDRKHAEQALRSSEERYRQLVETLPNAVFVLTNERLSFANSAFIKMMGANNLNDLLGRSAFEIAHPQYHDTARKRFDRIQQTGQASPSIEMKLVRLDGRPVTVHSVSAPFFSSSPNSILVALSDLTEREQSMELLQSIMRSVTDAILTIDEHGIIQSANMGATRIFGYSETELLGNNIKMLMPDPFRHEHDSYLRNYLQTGIARIIGSLRESEGIRRDGTRFPVELNVSEFTFNNRHRFTGVVRDITVRRQLETHVLQAQKMQAVGRLAGGIAHDFNNILMLINGHSDLLLQTLATDDPLRFHVEAIHESGQRAARLTGQLLAFSRKAAVEPKQIDLNQLVTETTKLLQPLVGASVVLHTQFDPLAPSIHVDRGQMEQVLMNLVLNARDAMPKGGTITIETHHRVLSHIETGRTATLAPGVYALLVISDTGQGMSPEVKANIFEPFFTTKDIGHGTGLGLAVVDGIVAQAGGQIQVQSTLGLGTTFTIWLPVTNTASTN